MAQPSSALLVLSLLACVLALPCPLADVGGYSAACLANSGINTPYCVAHPTGAACARCRSDCDCGYESYCSSAPNTLGTCVSYPSGSCVAMTDAELLSPSLPAEWKCATFYTDDQNVTHIDWKGFCAQNRCLACDPGPQALPSLGVPAVCAVPGNGPKRVCAFPGYWVSGDRVAWMSAIYANDVASIWLAMIFTLLLLIVIGWTVSGILACTRERQSKSV